MQLEYEMTFRERIEGPLPPTTGSPVGERLCWQVADARLQGPRIEARLAHPGADWMRLGSDGIRRQDLRAQFVAADGATVLMHYSVGIVRSNDIFMSALREGRETDWKDQYMKMIPEFIVPAGPYAWLGENLFVAEGRLSGAHQIEYQIYRVL